MSDDRTLILNVGSENVIRVNLLNEQGLAEDLTYLPDAAANASLRIVPVVGAPITDAVFTATQVTKGDGYVEAAIGQAAADALVAGTYWLYLALNFTGHPSYGSFTLELRDPVRVRILDTPAKP